MDKYFEIFNHLLDTDGKKALQIVYDEELKEYHDNSHAYLRYNLTDININLICLCGINIESNIDFELLKTMITTWDNQYLKIPLYLSIYSNVIKKEEIMNLIRDKFIIYYSENKLSQFEHFKNILNNIDNSEKIWCMFTNYDDIWARHRTCVFNILINLYNTCSFEKKPLYIKYHYVSDKNTSIDIVQYGCKLEYLKNFINNSHKIIINHHYCKFYLIKYLSLNDGVCLAFPDKTLFNEIYSNFRKDYYDKNDFKDTMILYFSKRKSFNVKDFENFWNYYIKHLDFNLVKKNSIILYNTDSDIKIFQDSPLIIEKQ